MTVNTIKHEIFDHKKWKRNIWLKLFRKKSFRKKFFHSDFFYQQILSSSPVPKKPLDHLVGSLSVVLEDFHSRNGNLSPYEILAIASLVKYRAPRRLLEIGTFDGNTTLQMALNSPDDAQIHTIDLPTDENSTASPILESDLQFILDEKKRVRKFENTSVSRKITQHFGDSTQYNFASFTREGPLDLIFIDGGHTYECVKSDTQKALPILSEQGCILWHDFTPHFGGVFQYLLELSRELPLVHIEGTNLVLYIPT